MYKTRHYFFIWPLFIAAAATQLRCLKFEWLWESERERVGVPYLTKSVKALFNKLFKNDIFFKIKFILMQK